MVLRLQCRQRPFELVLAMSLGGTGEWSIGRITGLSWNTVAGGLERAAAPCVEVR